MLLHRLAVKLSNIPIVKTPWVSIELTVPHSEKAACKTIANNAVLSIVYLQ